MPDSTPANPETVAEAWRLYTQVGLSVRGVADAMSLPKSTAETYIKKARVQHGYIELLEEAERRDAISSWLSLAIAKAEYWLERCNTPRDYAAVSGAMTGLAKRISDLHGLDQPVKFSMVDGKNGARPDADVTLIAALRKLKAPEAEAAKEWPPEIEEGAG